MAELALMLRNYEHVDTLRRVDQFTQTWQGELRTLTPLEHWLDRSRPLPSGRTGKGPKALSQDEIERRVAHYRHNVAGGEVFGEPYLGEYPEEVDRLCDEYRQKLEAR